MLLSEVGANVPRRLFTVILLREDFRVPGKAYNFPETTSSFRKHETYYFFLVLGGHIAWPSWILIRNTDDSDMANLVGKDLNPLLLL